MISMQDKHDSIANTGPRWTHGNGVSSRFGGAYPDGSLNLWSYGPAGYSVRSIKCRSYRRAVRVLRWHLMGYTV